RRRRSGRGAERAGRHGRRTRTAGRGMKSVFMFPGQSSLYPAMLERIMDAAPSTARPLLATASETLGRDLAWHYRSVNSDIFATNRDVQVGVFLTNHLHLAALEAAGVTAELSL